MKLTVLAPAKLNLFLDITGKRSDGYHIVNMVMQAVSLYDEVTVGLTDNDIRIECSDKEIPCDETNTAYRAAKAFFEAVGGDRGAVIRIKKRIPSQAGMAGGSTDAAAVLWALNELTGASLPLEKLADIAETIGADVPFCLYGGTMTAGGIGTILSPLPDMPECAVVVVQPDVRISTAQAYRLSDEKGYDATADAEQVIGGIAEGCLKDIGTGLYNKFEKIVEIPEIESVKETMMNAGAVGACLTGSGSAVFGLFEDRSMAEDCADLLEKKYDRVYVVKPVSTGPVRK